MFAAVDIGTNTVLLLVAEYDGRSLQVVREEQRTPRLGQGVDSNRNVSDDAVRRVAEALLEYREILDREFPDVSCCMVTATSAVRDAANSEELRSTIRNQTGFDLRILSGKEEAEWTYLGALSLLDRVMQRSFVIDIGGGSTELAIGEGPHLTDFHSYDIGSVRFTERFWRSDPPTGLEITRCRKAIRDALEQRPFSRPGELTAVGVAGTVTSLAFMDAGFDTYRSDDLNGLRVSGETVEKWAVKLGGMNTGDILKAFPEVMEGRADIILAGVLILDEFLKLYSLEDLMVSTGGIRHGAVIKAFEIKNRERG